MFSEDVVGLVEEMGFQPSSELSSTNGCWAEVDREGIPDDWCCNVEAPPTELSKIYTQLIWADWALGGNPVHCSYNSVCLTVPSQRKMMPPSDFYRSQASVIFKRHSLTQTLDKSTKHVWIFGSNVIFFSVVSPLWRFPCAQLDSVSVGILQKTAVSVRFPFFSAFSNFFHTKLAQFQA